MTTEQQRQKLLEAAGPIFAEKGYEGATVREICDRAGLNVASVNYYFGDKERLYIETVKQAGRRREESAPYPQWAAGTPPETKLHEYVVTMLTRMLRSETAAWQRGLMMREMLRPTKACEELVRDYIRPDFELIHGIIAELVGESVPQHVRNQISFSVVGQCLHYRVAGDVVGMLVGEEELSQHYGLPTLADHITRMTLAAIGVGEPLGSAKPFINSKA
ncbi:MAG TPA: DUF1956 domain-containing protein [Planctomycetaceae bacterium]|nr:DUF1956 domain-containing protein [Planctomycetaceae bacterium]